MDERIKELRRKLGLTQSEFAEYVGLSRSHISQIECGFEGANLSDRAIKNICDKCNVNEQWLRYGNGSMLNPAASENTVVDFLVDVLKNPGTDFKHRFIARLASLNPSQWKVLEEIASGITTKEEDNDK